MNTRRNAGRPESNWLLAALPEPSYRRISEQSEMVTMEHRQVLFEGGASIEHAHFPQTGCCLSMITVMGDGSAIEVGTIGHEGMSGVSLVHRVDSVPAKCIVQVEGMARRIPRAAFVAELQSAEVSSVMQRYAQVWADQIGLGGSCNAVHAIEERCARWLAMTHDRVQADVMPLTQDFLAIMLGVRRPSVTLAASTLQRAGLIEYTRGKITVLDREGLVAAACECYPAMQAAYDRLFPDTAPVVAV